MNMQIFGLLHLDEKQQTVMNVSIKDFREQVSIYVNNAIVLSRTLSSNGIPFTLLTNNRALIESCGNLQANSSLLSVVEISFTTKVPSGVRFYSAHYKLDAFRYLASVKNCYTALCDLDMVCINGFPLCFRNLVMAGIPLCYDISDQVIPAYGHDVIIRDLTVISGLESEGRWSGGEFISGTPDFFDELVKEIDGIYDNYVSNISSLHHIGDEAFTSAALEKLKRKGVYIADAGTIGIVGRYWNCSVLHPQNSFGYFKDCFLLHLPADKKFISDLAQQDTEVLSQFKDLYERQLSLFSKKMQKSVLSIIRIFKNIMPKKLL